jgi:hypothetical protein
MDNLKWLNDMAVGIDVKAWSFQDNGPAEIMQQVIRHSFRSCADELEALRSLADDLVKWYEDDFMVNVGDETLNGFYDRARKLRSGSEIA